MGIETGVAILIGTAINAVVSMSNKPSAPPPPGQPAPTISYGADGVPTSETGYNADGSAFTKTYDRTTGRERLLRDLPAGDARITEIQGELTGFAEEERVAEETRVTQEAEATKLKEDRTATQTEIRGQLDEILADPSSGFDEAAFRQSLDGAVQAYADNIRGPIEEDRVKLAQQDAAMFAARGATGSRAEVDLQNERRLQQERVDQEIGNAVSVFEETTLQNERNFFEQSKIQKQNFLQDFLQQTENAISSTELIDMQKSFQAKQENLLNIQAEFEASRGARQDQALQANLQQNADLLRQNAYAQDLRQFQNQTNTFTNTLSDLSRFAGRKTATTTGQTPGITSTAKRPDSVAPALDKFNPFARGTAGLDGIKRPVAPTVQNPFTGRTTAKPLGGDR